MSDLEARREWDGTSLEARLSDIKSLAARNFIRDGYLLPVVFLNLSGSMKIVGLRSLEGNDDTATMLRKVVLPLIKDGSLTEFLLVAEGHMTSMSEEEYQRFMSTGSRPNTTPEPIINLLFSSPSKQYTIVGKKFPDRVEWENDQIETVPPTGTSIPTRCGHLWQEARTGMN